MLDTSNLPRADGDQKLKYIVVVHSSLNQTVWSPMVAFVSGSEARKSDQSRWVTSEPTRNGRLRFESKRARIPAKSWQVRIRVDEISDPTLYPTRQEFGQVAEGEGQERYWSLKLDFGYPPYCTERWILAVKPPQKHKSQNGRKITGTTPQLRPVAKDQKRGRDDLSQLGPRDIPQAHHQFHNSGGKDPRPGVAFPARSSSPAVQQETF